MTQRTGNEDQKIIELIRPEEDQNSTMVVEIFVLLIVIMIGQINSWIEPLIMFLADYMNP